MEKMGFEKSLQDGFNFAADPKRILYYLGLHFLFLCVAGFFFLLVSLLVFSSIFESLQSFDPSVLLKLISGVFLLLVLVIVFVVALIVFSILVTAAFIDSARDFLEGRPFNLRKSLGVAWSKTLSLLFASFLVFLLICLAFLLVFLGFLTKNIVLFIVLLVFSILFILFISLGFAFVSYYILIGDTGVVEGVQASFNLFKGNPLTVFVVCMLVGISSYVIALVGSIPYNFLSNLALAASFSPLYFYIPLFLFAGLIYAVVYAFNSLFCIGFMTSAFLQLASPPHQPMTAQPATQLLPQSPAASLELASKPFVPLPLPAIEAAQPEAKPLAKRRAFAFRRKALDRKQPAKKPLQRSKR
ncbi:hypothetical protein HY991_00845 [Candidatus Micrarchaeota archaeon]|nr:hypothetical protein [Candidatus Micrarchaeota archaeon]